MIVFFEPVHLPPRLAPGDSLVYIDLSIYPDGVCPFASQAGTGGSVVYIDSGVGLQLDSSSHMSALQGNNSVPEIDCPYPCQLVMVGGFQACRQAGRLAG
jgi:hypothetical protein